jgi:ferredoxin-type protein NapH
MNSKMSSGLLRRNRYLLARRALQAGILILFVLANAGSLQLLKGDLSYSEFLEVVPLSDPFAVMQMLFAGIAVTGTLLIGAVIMLGFYALIAGRSFCSWVCPMNLVADAAAGLRRILHIDEIDRAARISRTVRYWALALSLVMSLLLGVGAFEMLSPVSILHRGIIYGMGLGWLIIIAVFLFDLLGLKSGFCGHLCPLGAFYSVTTRFSLIRIDHRRDKCTLCMKCRDLCPEPQVLPMIGKYDDFVRSGECTNCARCIDVCDDDAMKFGIRSFAGAQVVAKKANN